MKEFKNLDKRVNLRNLYWNELGKPCSAHDAVFSDGKDLAKRTISDKNLNDRTCEIAKNRK